MILTERSCTVCKNWQFNIDCYREIHKQKKKPAIQQTLDVLVKKKSAEEDNKGQKKNTACHDEDQEDEKGKKNEHKEENNNNDDHEQKDVQITFEPDEPKHMLQSDE